MIDLEPCRLKPYNHQVVGINKLVNEPIVGLFDEMGAGKSLQTIVAAQILYTQKLITRVIIVAPASVRYVWYDPELGELEKHLWEHIPSRVMLYRGKIREWSFGPKTVEPPFVKRLEWMIVNYEFIRNTHRLEPLFPFTGLKTLLILDESSLCKSWKAKQTKSCMELRKRCGRIVLLNGTPIANSPKDLFSQGQLMDKKILDCKTIYNFRARYGVLGGWQGRAIISWQNLEDLQQRFAPYVLRRLKEDCLDLPSKLSSVALTATLTPETWKIYKEMREEMIIWLTTSHVSLASQAAVKGIRLSQVTSGFLGGVHESGLDTEPEVVFEELRPDWIPFIEDQLVSPAETEKMVDRILEKTDGVIAAVQEISSEKLNLFIDWLDGQLEADPNLKLLVWCRFRPELNRLFVHLEKHQKLQLGKIWGGQKKGDRENALRLLDPRTMPQGPVVVVGTPASGSMGLNLSGAHTVVYMSNDYSLKTRLQSEDRVHRPGQKYPVSYFDIIAEGPKGQKTIDHAIIRALRNKQDIANWTTSAWLDALREE